MDVDRDGAGGPGGIRVVHAAWDAAHLAVLDVGDRVGRAGQRQRLGVATATFLEDLVELDGPGRTPHVVGVGNGSRMQAQGRTSGGAMPRSYHADGSPVTGPAYAPGRHRRNGTMGMAAQDALAAELQAGYGFEDDAIVLGRALAPDLETPITSASCRCRWRR